jgi:hypothetical protein
LQIDESMRAALRSSRSTAGSPVPSAGPGPRLLPPDDSAVPAELVPGVPGAEPNAPPVVEAEPAVEAEWCIPIPAPPEPRPDAAVADNAERRMQAIVNVFMTVLLLAS